MKKAVQQVLIRAQRDAEFVNRMLTNPTIALEEYNLTDAEKKALSSQLSSFYELLCEVMSPQGLPIDLFPYLIIVILLAKLEFPQLDELERLVDSIRASSGSARLDLIVEMLQAMSGEEPGENE